MRFSVNEKKRTLSACQLVSIQKDSTMCQMHLHTVPYSVYNTHTHIDFKPSPLDSFIHTHKQKEKTTCMCDA